ncbi:MAG: hypothetical protein KDH16_05890 [Rhodocyclaceae bacterium]|nr:hypothetical protein [Rhodocyclaceae bacterium]
MDMDEVHYAAVLAVRGPRPLLTDLPGRPLRCLCNQQSEVHEGVRSIMDYASVPLIGMRIVVAVPWFSTGLL